MALALVNLVHLGGVKRDWSCPVLKTQGVDVLTASTPFQIILIFKIYVLHIGMLATFRTLKVQYASVSSSLGVYDKQMLLWGKIGAFHY